MAINALAFRRVGRAMQSLVPLLLLVLYISCSLACSSSADCPSHQWCRTARDKTTECVDYAKAGEICGGYVASFARQQCAPDHACQYSPSHRTDTHGMCVKKCQKVSDCLENQFCNEDGFCLNHEQCIAIKDCLHPDNQLALPRCVYATECNNNRCQHSCLALCASDIDCSEAQKCYFEHPADTTGYCLQNCKHSFNCPPEYVCEDNICKDPVMQK